MSSADSSFRWLEDVIIELTGTRPNAELKLVIVADVKKEYNIGKAEEIHPNERIPCQEAGSVIVELCVVKRFKKNERILLIAIPSGDESSQTDANNVATVQPKFAYTRGGDLREQVENSRQITNEQQAILDKIERVRRFFESLQGICNSVKEVHQYVEAAFSALLLLYNLCEKQKKCRDAARGLVDEMDDLLSYGVEQLSDLLKENSNTRAAFKSISQVIIEASKYLAANDKRSLFVTFIRDAVSPSYERKLEELRNKLKRAIGGLKDSVTFGTWEITVDHALERRLKSVSTAHYQSGARCLMNTRKHLLKIVDVWARDPSQEKLTWVYGYAGSGKSALYNSIAENLEKAGIPFTCFTCKRDDPELSDVQRVLPTLAYAFTQIYDDYRGVISNLAKQPAGLSIATGDVRKQIELLFGKCPDYELINSTTSRRPAVHVILIDALDECRDVRERVALAKFLRDLADAVPWIKVLITSRRVPDIVNVLGDVSHNAKRIDINDDEWDTNTDIRRFIQHRSDELEIGLLPNQVDRLQEMAAGLFVWCSTVFRYFEGSRKGKRSLIKEILDSPSLSKVKTNPFSSLYSLYQRVLDSAVSDEDDKSTMESILSVIYVAASNQPLSSSAIADILYPNEQGKELEERRVWVANLTKSLFAILYVEEGTNVVRTCHPSVLDFTGEKLTADKTRGSIDPFSIGLEGTHVRVFDGCLTIMDRDLRFNICGLEDSFRLNKDVQDLPSRIARHISEALRYVSLFWACHLVQSNSKESSERVAEFLNSPKVLFWIEVLSLLGVVERGTLLLQDCASFFTDKPEILAIADEWERFLLAYGEALESTPHLYLLPSSWLPQSSRLRDIVSKFISLDVPMVSNVGKTWAAERWSEYIGSPVRCVAYSSDGQYFAAGCWDGSVHFWEARSGKEAREPLSSGSDVTSICFSQDGRWLASGHWDDIVRVWDLSKQVIVPRRLEGHTNIVSSVAFSSDGKRIASGAWDNTVAIWDVDTGAAVCDPFKSHTASVESIVFTSDDKRIISGSMDAVYVWDYRTDEATSIDEHWAHSVACSHDNRFIAVASRGVNLFRANAGTPIGDPQLLPGQHGIASSVSFSADSKYVVAGFYDHSVCVWDVETCLLVCELRGHMKRASSVAFAPVGQKILSGSWDGTVRVWDFKDAVFSYPLGSRSNYVHCVAYSSDGSYFASASRDREILLWDADTGAQIGEPIKGHTDFVNAIAFSGDGLWFVSCSNDGSLRIWDTATGMISGGPLLGHRYGVISVAISPNSQLIASGSFDHTVRLWDVVTRTTVAVFSGHSDSVNSMAFSADGRYIISGSYDDTLRIWDVQTGSALGSPHQVSARSVVVSPDGRWIAFSTWSAICIWCISPYAILEPRVTCEQQSVHSVTFSPDSKFVISGSDGGEVRVWNVQTGEVVGTPLLGHTRCVNSVSCSRNGRHVVSGASDGTLRVWDIQARTDLELCKGEVSGYSNLREEELRIRWNAGRARMDESESWVRDGEKLLLWLPLQYRRGVRCGSRLLIGSRGEDTLSPQVDHNILFRYSGRRWIDVCSAVT